MCVFVHNLSGQLPLPPFNLSYSYPPSHPLSLSQQVTQGRPELRNTSRFSEQLRHLLTQNSGRLPLDSLQGLYIASFGSPTDADLQSKAWLDKKLIHWAPHVVNLAGQRWAVWAPTGRPYPSRQGNMVPPQRVSYPSRQEDVVPAQPVTQGWPVLDCETAQLIPSDADPRKEGEREGEKMDREEEEERERVAREEREREIIGREEEEGRERVRMEEGTEKKHLTQALLDVASAQHISPEHSTSASTAGEPLALGDSPQHIPSLNTVPVIGTALPAELSTGSTEISQQLLPTPPSPRGTLATPEPALLPTDRDETTSSPSAHLFLHNGTEAPLLTLQDKNPFQFKLQPLPSSSPSCSDAAATPSLALDEDDCSPYGFLRKEPKLLAELTLKEEDTDNAISTAEALERLLEAGRAAHATLPDLPPPPPVQSSQKKSFSPEMTPKMAPSDKKPVDYLEAGMTPDEVLQEMYKVKDSGGGILKPSSMEPFLDYFGELSSRELERLESHQPKPQRSTTSPAQKGKLRNKRMIAIRFPGQTQDPFPDTTDPTLRKKPEAIQRKLPEVPESSDSSDSDTCPHPVTRAELLKQLMDKKYFSSDEEEENGSEKVALEDTKVSPQGPPNDSANGFQTTH